MIREASELDTLRAQNATLLAGLNHIARECRDYTTKLDTTPERLIAAVWAVAVTTANGTSNESDALAGRIAALLAFVRKVAEMPYGSAHLSMVQAEARELLKSDKP